MFKKPNYSHWVYKNRSGMSNVIIWSYMNLGNMREEPLFVTDMDYNLLDVSPINIVFEDDNTMIEKSNETQETALEKMSQEEIPVF